MLKVINYKYKKFTRHRTQHYQRLKFWVTSKGELHIVLSKGAGERLCHLSTSGVHRSRCARWRRGSWRRRSRRRWHRKNHRHEFGRVLLRLYSRSSIRGSHLLPVHLLTMRLGESDDPFDMPFHRQKLHLKHGVFYGLECFDQLPEVANRQLIFLPQK
jgi:hypothetical protein